MNARKQALRRLLAGALACVLGLGLVAWVGTRVLVSIFGGASTTASAGTAITSGPDRGEAFPQLDLSALSPTQTELVRLLEEQYDLQPPRTTFSEGVNEPWCADFVSWIFQQIGRPLTNPTNGGWRIPGVATLEDHLRQSGQWLAADQNPQLGDIAIYATDSLFGQHANIVLGVADNRLVTIGGNEHGLIRVTTHDLTNPDLKLRGLGRINLN